MRHSSGRAVIAACGVAVALVVIPVLASPTSSFHLSLKRSAPGRDSIVSVAPRAITLWFTQKPEIAVTTMSLQDANSTKVTLSAVRFGAADETIIVADIKGPMRPGLYTVQWKTSSRDGHLVRGDFGFTVSGPK